MSFLTDYKNKKCKTLMGDFFQTLIFNDAFKGLIMIAYTFLVAIALIPFEIERFNLPEVDNTARLIMLSPALLLLAFLIVKWVGYLILMLLRVIGNGLGKIAIVKKWLSK